MIVDLEWADEELQAAVSSYIEMLRMERSQIPYSKTEFRRKLKATALSGRSDSAIEYRMQNISAVLQSRGKRWIAGYKPAKNVGQANDARLASMIKEAEEFQAVKIPHPELLKSVVGDQDALMGVKAVFGPLGSHVLCFGARGTINDKSYFSVAAGAARRAVKQPFIITIGGGKEVRGGFEGRVINLARCALVYGPTRTLVSDLNEAQRLSQWPVSIALHDAWRFVGMPNLIEDLGFPDRTILAGSQDGIIRPAAPIEKLWEALREWPVESIALPFPINFYDDGSPTLVHSKLPGIPATKGAEEGERVWKTQLALERDSKLASEAKRLNFVKNGIFKCEACDFFHSDAAMFDTHHLTPLAAGKRHTFPEHLAVLCPTCHRRAHRKGRMTPYSTAELRDWVGQGRP
ncbi:HNH endonuclease [Pararhizobium sp. O133]|uniref:HNH endonuclease n=1 Tax=Pararhizobium sp. O133 TaxID=3449278 RepID=UPI003F688F9D